MAQKSADTLRVYWRDQVPDVDPYYNSLRTGLIVAHQAWDGLVFRDPNGFVMKPLLAESWKWIDDTTLEFELRTNARFQNGDPVTSADVVYTIQQATDPKMGNAVPSNYAWIAGAEAIDPTHVRIKTKSAFPAALQYLAFVTPIYPAAYRERVGHQAYKTAPVGAGPYKITKVDGVNEIDLERFEDYYAESSKPKPAIKKLVIKEVTDASSELTALLGGQADWIWQFNPDQFDNIARVPTLTAMRQEAFRVLFLDMEAAGRDGQKGPMTNVLVRRAVAHAIDRKTFADKLVQGGSRVPDALCYFTQFGCDQAAAVKYDYEPRQGEGAAGRGRLPERPGHRNRQRQPADLLDRRVAGLSRRRGHPRQGHQSARRRPPRCGRRRDDAPILPVFLGILFRSTTSPPSCRSSSAAPATTWPRMPK